VFAAAGALAAIAIGCGSSFDDFCKNAMQCEGGNDKDRQACVDSAEEAKKAASDYGCSNEFDSYQKCITGNTSCKNGVFVTSNDCSSAFQTLDTCKRNASSVGHGGG
jgi:hypothetical protein